MYQQTTGQTPGAIVGAQAAALMRRLLDLERMLGVQEWWMMGGTIAAAKVLAEVASLIPVARAELDQCLVQFCGSDPVPLPASGDAPAVPPDMKDAGQVAAQRDAATKLLRTMIEALPPTTQFARQLRAFAERAGLPATGVDVLAIVADRLSDAQEAVQSVVM
jgi:hypothetical protein